MATPADDGLLRRERSALVAIDLQERLMPAIADGEAVAKAAGMLIDAARTLAVPVVATEQYPKGLGPTVPAIAGRLPDDAPVVAKLTFGAVRNRDFTAHIDALAAEGRDHLVLCGVESHVCVLQTAAALHARGVVVHLAVDACGSRRAASKDAALARCRAMGISCVTVEMVLFEWLEAAGTDEFKAVSTLVK